MTDSRPLSEMLFQDCTKVANALHMNVGVIRLNYKNDYCNFLRVVIASSATKYVYAVYYLKSMLYVNLPFMSVYVSRLFKWREVQ